MKRIPMFVTILLLLTFVCSACQRKELPSSSKGELERRRAITEDQLNRTITNGVLREKILGKYGKPDLHYIDTKGRNVDLYHIPAAEGQNSWTHRFSGFEVVYKEDRVIEWWPVYSSRMEASQGRTSLPPGQTNTNTSITFRVNLELDEENALEKSNEHRQSPLTLKVQSIKSVHKIENEQTRDRIAFELYGEDARSLLELSTKSVGKRMVIEIGQKRIGLGLVNSPIENGKVVIGNLEPEESQMLQSTLQNMIRPPR